MSYKTKRVYMGKREGRGEPKSKYSKPSAMDTAEEEVYFDAQAESTSLTWNEVARLTLKKQEDATCTKNFIISRSSTGYFSKTLRLDFERKTATGKDKFVQVTMRDRVLKQLDTLPLVGSSININDGQHNFIILPIPNVGIIIHYARDDIWNRSTIGLTFEEIDRLQIFNRLFDEFYY